MIPWVVLVADPAGIPVNVLAAFIAAHDQVPRLDADHRARAGRGFLAEGLAQEAALPLAAAATAAGIPCLAIPESSAPAPQPAVSAHGARFDPAALTLLIGIPPTPQDLAWTDLRAAALAFRKADAGPAPPRTGGASVGARAVRIGVLLTTGIPLPLGKAKPEGPARPASDTSLFLDLMDGQGRRWRISSEGFNFSGLGAGAGLTGVGNLKSFLERIARQASRALLNPMARAFLAGRPLAPLAHEGPAEFDKECRWLLALAGRTP